MRCSTVFLTAVFVLFFFRAGAQDARFSQWAATPQLVNPALTGVMNGEYRITANYRDLYSATLGSEGLQSYTAGVEMRRPAGNGNFFGLGLQVQQDEGGTSRFRRNQAVFSASYQQSLGSLGRKRGTGHFISGGAQVGIGTRGIDLNKLTYSNQYFVDEVTREAYLDTNLPTGETFTGSSSLYPNVSAGVGYFANFGDRKGAYLGLAGYNLSTPDVSPDGGQRDQLDRRYVFHAGGELPLGRGAMSLLPSARVMVQGRGHDALVGSNLRYTERNWREVALRAGLFAQWNNELGFPDLHAFIVTVGLETERVQFGVAYDIAVNDIGTITNGRGGFELGLVYLIPASYRSRVTCPKF